MVNRIQRMAMLLCLSLCIAAGMLPLGITVNPAEAHAATAFSDVTVNTTTPAMYDKYEISFNLSETYDNPFDPEEVNVYATFSKPGGGTEVVPGFYKSNSSPHWAVRYSPRLAGAHNVVLRVVDASGIGQSQMYAFTAGGPGQNRGFMDVEGDRFVDSYGSQITLIGTNFAWNNPNPDAVIDEIPNLKPAKMNLLRVWYSCWWSSLAPEWGPVVAHEAGLTTTYEGIGRYQLDNQQRMDEMLEAAEDNDVYIMLTMNSFGDMYYQWSVNAYNTANGGPSTYSENNTNFWTHPDAIGYQKKLLRYMFARFGYSRALGMLEYWNELDNRVDTTAANRAAWHAEVDSYWKSLDFYNHPTTTSFAWKDHANSGQTSWENLTMLDVTNVHRYDDSAGVVDAWAQQINNLRTIGGNKPAFIGEVGRTHNDQTTDPVIANYMHNALWAPIFRAGAAGGSLWWIFENGFELPPSFKAIHTRLADFVQPEEDHLIDLPHADYGTQSNGTKAGGFNDGSRALLWINDPQGNHTVASPRTVSGMSLSVPMDNGYYDVSFYNTYTGTYGAVQSVQATGGTLTLSVPSFTRDIAVNIKCENCDAPDTTAPSVPTGLTSQDVTDTSVQLVWTPSTDNVRVSNYDVYRNGTLIGSTGGATSYNATGLTPNTSYSFTVRAKDSAGNASALSSTYSVTTDPLDTTAPTAPTSLTSPSKLDISVTLSWGASTDDTDVTGYDIYRNGTLVGSVLGNATTYVDTGLVAETAYSYYVKARDARGNASAASNTISVTTLPHIELNRLLNPGFEGGGGKPNSWVCENDYFCYRDTAVKRTGAASMRMSGDTGPWLGFYQDVTAAPGETFTFDGYMNMSSNSGTTVEVRLRFLDGSNSVIQDNLLSTHTGTPAGFLGIGGSKVAPTGTAAARVYIYLKDLRGAIYFDDFTLTGGSGGGPVTDTTAPTAPTGLTSPSITTTTVNLSWNASTDNVGVTGYDVYKDGVLAGSVSGSTTAYSATGLTANTAYSFTVKAKDAAGNASAASSALSVTTQAAPDTTAPTAPTGLTSPSKTTTTVNLSWTASTDNVGVTGYDVYKDGVLAGSVSGSTTSYSATGLTANTAYSFTVKAKDAAGNASAASSALSVTTLSSGGGGSNLLVNGGFETLGGNSKPSTWVCEQDYYCYTDTSVKRSGDRSLRIDGNSGPWFAVYQSVAGSAATSYTLDGYVNIASNNNTKMDIKVQFLDGSGSVLTEHTALSVNGTTTSGFVNVNGTYTAPANTSSVRVHIYYKDMRAVMYVDDFSLTAN